LQEVDMVDRRQLPLGLLAEHHGAVARLVAADELAQELRVILRLVANAGYTWQDIGNALGVSRAAAHERFSPGNSRASRQDRRVR
jgi:DNA-directed RNA polymerase specialized sigma24 family protein